MEIVERIVYFIPSFIECFILWRLMNSVLELKCNKVISTVVAIGMFAIIQLKDLLDLIPVLARYEVVISAIVLIYTFLAFQLLAKNTFVEKLIWWGVYALGLIVIEVIWILILNVILNQPLNGLSDMNLMNLSVVVIGKFMTLMLFEIIIRKHKGRLNIGISYFKELAIIIIFNLLLAIVVVFACNNRYEIMNHIDNIILLIFGLVLLITLYTVALIFRIERKSNEELATQLKLQQIELELKLNIDMVTITDKLRNLRHDMNNHIGLMKTLVKEEKYEELKDYMNQIYEDVEIANELVLTENKTLSVLLNAKKSLAKEKNIDFTSFIATKDINMQSKDICSLLGNILDNAIEAAEKAGNKKYIQLMIQKTEEGCVINCENSLSHKPIIKKGKFITIKENSLIHGIGTENIKDIVEKYKGEITFEYDEEIFNVHVLLPV